ncbi:glutathione peroxidase 7-like [Watersipora subatra]|uniref:glutathione peroxidase 7-like n=1 Tax=Watersipora subatra TaxID=2589382 RepID=UPI00355B7CA3
MAIVIKHACYCLLIANVGLQNVLAQDRRFYEFTAVDSHGSIIDLRRYQGKVTLVTNVASYCGYTESHYHQLVELQREHESWLNILAFPCNQFGTQEPEDVHTIRREMNRKFRVNFEIFEKVDVLGDNVTPMWRYLIEESKTTPQWNFYKYLVDAHGQVIGAWGPKADVYHIKPYVEDAINDAKSFHSREEL